ncbi:hypothetical protein F0562_028302 [Nyssa sinensis]|uniref:Uncharacterized protein n=1 Tax=Nyssa sinensis TaxID=561372 RepID=A0A5J5BAD3_9ASTE|nr:hypothetical protein F0562_028302 [Nyssa sinensis]
MACSTGGTKRGGVDLELRNDGNSDSEYPGSGEKPMAKKPRVFGTIDENSSGLEQVSMEIEAEENDGAENRLISSQQSGFAVTENKVCDSIDEKVTVSEGLGVENEGKRNELIENQTMGVQELGFLAEEDRILRRIDVFGTEVRKEEEIVFKENERTVTEVGIEIEAKESELIGNPIVGFEESGDFVEEDTILRASEECRSGDREEEKINKCDYLKELWKLGPGSGCSSSIQSSESIEIVDDVKGKEKFDFDLNVPAVEMDEGGNDRGLQEYDTPPILVIADRRAEIIDISSGESEDECEKFIDKTDAEGKDKKSEEGIAYGCMGRFNLDLGLMEIGPTPDGSSSMSSSRRYTREEKGKAKLVDSCLSLATKPMPLDLEPKMHELVIEHDVSRPVDTTRLQGTENSEFRTQQAISSVRAAQPSRQRAHRVRNHVIPSRHASRLAFAYPHREYSQSFEQDMKVPFLEADKELEDLPGPFSSAMKIITERNLKQSAQKLIEWKPSENHAYTSLPLVPSLLDLSIKILAKNAEAIVSLEPVPDALKHKLTELLCNSRRMSIHVLDLLVRGSPTEIRIKDCSWMIEEQFTKTFGSFDSKNLKVLQLDLCGQCVLDDILGKSLARSSNSLRDLAIISLRGACRLSGIALKALVASAPALQSINLGQCSLLSHTGIDILANSLGSVLRELYIDDCQRIDAMLIVPALKKFEHLEVLSVAGIHSVCDKFVSDIIAVRGHNMKELDLADCVKLTDISLKVIGNTCSGLRSLNISNLHKLTDLALQYLANGCQSIQTLKLCRNGFSDETIAAFLEASGESLKELSLNNVSKVGPNTALSLAKCSRKLLVLDLSWCRKITNEALGLILDSCLLLKLVKLFGCTQVWLTPIICNSNGGRFYTLNLLNTIISVVYFQIDFLGFCIRCHIVFHHVDNCKLCSHFPLSISGI